MTNKPRNTAKVFCDILVNVRRGILDLIADFRVDNLSTKQGVTMIPKKGVWRWWEKAATSVIAMTASSHPIPCFNLFNNTTMNNRAIALKCQWDRSHRGMGFHSLICRGVDKVL